MCHVGAFSPGGRAQAGNRGARSRQRRPAFETRGKALGEHDFHLASSCVSFDLGFSVYISLESCPCPRRPVVGVFCASWVCRMLRQPQRPLNSIFKRRVDGDAPPKNSSTPAADWASIEMVVCALDRLRLSMAYTIVQELGGSTFWACAVRLCERDGFAAV